MITYTTATYARVWEWDSGNDEWDFLGDIHMNSSNTVIGAPSKVQTFTIDVSTIEVPD